LLLGLEEVEHIRLGHADRFGNMRGCGLIEALRRKQNDGAVQDLFFAVSCDFFFRAHRVAASSLLPCTITEGNDWVEIRIDLSLNKLLEMRKIVNLILDKTVALQPRKNCVEKIPQNA
jgi:hypothetical protein